MTHSDMRCRLNDRQGPTGSGNAQDPDGYWWPGSYAGGVLARYARRYGERALLVGHVCDHVAAVHGWDEWRDVPRFMSRSDA